MVPSDQEQLKDRLNRRFDSMLQRGFEAEVEMLRQRSALTPDCPSMRSVGYRQMWQYLDGDLSENEMKDQAKAATRQLAKRQLTWLRSWRADTNTLIEVSNLIPIEKGKIWLSGVLDRVFERKNGGERAIICSVTIREPFYIPDVEEFFSLVTSAGAKIVGKLNANRKDPVLLIILGLAKSRIGGSCRRNRSRLSHLRW